MRGVVRDKVPGPKGALRTNHAPVVLKGWHRVIRNTAIGSWSAQGDVD